MIVEKPNVFLSCCEINATKFGTQIRFHLISFGLYHAVEIDHTILLLMFVAEKVRLLLVISLTVNGFGELLHLLETLNSGTLLIFIFHSIMYRVILIICSCKLSTMAVLVCSVSNLSSGIFGFGGGSSPVWH